MPKLATAADLFRKAEADLAAFDADPENTQIAFNLFVTIEHISDWLGKRAEVQQNAILRTVSHIANGSKHFGPLQPRHQSVVSTSIGQYAENYNEPGYWERRLTFHLEVGEIPFIGSDHIDAYDLAKQALNYWRLSVPGL